MAKICVALNTNSWKEAKRIVDKLRGEADLFKVGLPLYTRSGHENVEALIKDGVKVFLDLKLHDIPSVVAQTVQDLPSVSYLTVHATGGRRMMEKVVELRPDIRMVAVTLLTSLSDEEAREIFRKTPRKLVIQLSRTAVDSGAWGVVVSGLEARAVRKYFKMLNLVVPGVRMKRGVDDHARVVPPERLRWLAEDDIVVVGREITEAKDPVATLRKFKKALHKRKRA
ncbi:MAG: orotidine-5'-phosphate decarboxylase [Thermotogae bacterium]|nr:orotidine-5'-phosphate decarboxylase [Thermotogota bacterium]